MGCRRMLGVEDRAAIMAGLEAGLSQVCIAHLIGRSPSVSQRSPAMQVLTGRIAEKPAKPPAGVRRRPKKRLLDRNSVLRRRVIADLSQGHTPRQISGRLRAEACGTLPTMDTSPDAQGHTISHEAIYTWTMPPQEDAHRTRHLLALAPVDAQETPHRRAHTPHCWDAID